MVSFRGVAFHLAFLFGVVVIAGCNGSYSGVAAGRANPDFVTVKRASGISKIKHVV